MVLRYLLWGSCTLAGLVVASLNADVVVFRYFFSDTKLPLYLLLLLSFTIGWLIGVVLNIIGHIKLNAHNRRLQEHCFRLKEEVTRLKKDFSPEEN